MAFALSGIRVIDISDSIAGQFCCRMLADFGADVLLVEPVAGSTLRQMPPFDPKQTNQSLLFFHLNLGKQSLVLDREASKGASEFEALVTKTDIVVVGNETDRAAVQALNPDCIVTLVSDFGADGPYGHWRGSEMIFQALSGMMHVNGSGDRQPLYGVGHRAQYATGVGAYIATLAALYARGQGAGGQSVAIDIAMNTASMAPPSTLEYAYSGLQDPRGDRRSPFSVIQCSDGWVSYWIHLHTWPAFCKTIDLPELEHDPRFAKGKERQDNWQELTSIVQRQARKWTSDEFLNRLLKARLAAAKAYTPMQLWSGTPHLQERNYWQSVTTPEGARPVLGPQYRLGGTPRQFGRGAPALGSARAVDLWPEARQALPQPTEASASREGPLKGLRILDFTTAWAGPMTGRILAFLGAEVIHVESATRLDVWRMHNAVFSAKRFPDGVAGERPYNRSALFNSQNHDKLSLSMDIKHPKGLDAMLKLAATSDAAICNFTAGTLGRMGFGYEALKAIKPDIIVMEMPGFGNSGPLANCTANGATMENAAGMCAMIGYPGGPPTTTGQVYPDPMGGYNGAAALMTALIHRQRTGQGQAIEMPQIEAAMQFIGEEILHAIAAGQDPEPQGNRVRWAAPHDAYPAAGDDQWIAIAVGSDAEWQTLCEMMQQPQLASDPRFATFDQRWANQDGLRETIAAWTCQTPKAELAERLQRAGVRAAPVNMPADVLASPYLEARQAFVVMTHPEAGTHPYMTLPFRLSVTPGRQRRASPCLGADTTTILAGIGLSDAQIAELDAEGVISSRPVS